MLVLAPWIRCLILLIFPSVRALASRRFDGDKGDGSSSSASADGSGDDDEDVSSSPTQPLPLYQQRENLFS